MLFFFIMRLFMKSQVIKNQAKLSSLAIALSAVSVVAFANDSTEPTATLPEITITATRTPLATKNTIAQMTVIDEEDLKRYQGQSVLDVLRHQGGFYITQNGGDGTSGGVRLRGYNSNAVLVLIDGIRYSSATTGSPALSLIPADQIDRIEVLHGASGSSLYGSDAMGGVIQIFTKGQNANQSNVALTVGAGTQDSYKGQITGQLVNQNSTLSLSAGYEKTGGINATNTNNSYSYYADKDGFESKNASLVAKQRLNDNIDVGLTGLYAESTTDYDSSRYDSASGQSLPYINTYSDQKNGAVSAFANANYGKLTANVKYGQSFDKSTAYDGSTPTGGQYDTKQQQANLQLGYQLPIGQIIGGYEHLKQEVDSTKPYTVDNRTVKSVFAGYLLNNDKFDAQLNVRNDDNSQFGNETTYNVGGAYRILPNLRVGASYATNFRAPTFNDLYFPGSENPKLKAETSKNSEIFVEHSNDLQKTRLTAFQSDVKDKLKWVTTDFTTYAGQMQNIDKAKMQGISLTSDWAVNNTLFGLNYDYLDTEDKTSHKELTYQPNHKGLIYVGYKQSNYDVRAEVQHVGERFRDTANNNSLDSYTLLNLSGNYYLNPNLTISSRLNNLTGEDYETVYGYNQKGVNAFVSATYKWF